MFNDLFGNHPLPWAVGNVDGYFVVNDANGQPVCYPDSDKTAAQLCTLAHKAGRLFIDKDRILRNGYDPTDVSEEQLREMNASVWLNAMHPGNIDDAIQPGTIRMPPNLDMIDPDTNVVLIRSYNGLGSGTIYHIAYVADTYVETDQGLRLPIQHVRRCGLAVGDQVYLMPGQYVLYGGMKFMLTERTEGTIINDIGDQDWQIEIGERGTVLTFEKYARIERKIEYGEVEF